jgi:TATA box-binding protein-associated factor RNA polymerase I subunit A
MSGKAAEEKVVMRFVVGDELHARWKGTGKFYDCKVLAVNEGAGTYDLVYSDGDKATVEDKLCRSKAQGTAPFLVGDTCYAPWKNGGKSYKCTILAINDDGKSYSLVYEDGDKDPNVSREKCTLMPKAGFRPQKPLLSAEELQAIRAREAAMSTEDRRARYKYSTFTEAKSVPMWNEYGKEIPQRESKCAVRDDLNGKVALWRGNICALEIDAIVNAANERCLGGGGIDGAIHGAAGSELYEECRTLNGCPTGETKTTLGYKLPAKYVLHSVGPMGEVPEELRSCYRTLLERCKEEPKIRSVALCGISTGIFGYPLLNAAKVALSTVRAWLEEGDNATHVDQILFVNFKEEEELVYETLMPEFFPLPEDDMAPADLQKRLAVYTPPPPRRQWF